MELQNEGQAMVHPLARWFAGLSAPMSLRDQQMVRKGLTRVFCVFLFLPLIAGFFFEHIGMVFYGVVMGCVVSLVLFGPNWYQREDPDQRWCDEAEVKEYYRVRQMLIDELEEEESNEELQALTKNRAEGDVEEKM
ncbi:hypothetical protein, conserved [Trypanosoma cruzi]|uniref:Uncharacterized protein n=1 Tax=Trypanosoma cruzi (strain CL Brener) TaxID=353153 RepID=Q4E2K8_TRYCC|nr:hypothetical protein, conserved [Trypanosoma cruzi]EAN99003.1 hypothetical protein, conserved [Trypanosoma cruzi]|eukprot:XP_820854.1 hypothetical protein [Trypanosoma cruzi strain CL Brener]